MSMPSSAPERPLNPVMRGARALVVGIANDSSLARGVARALRRVGCEIALTYRNEKAKE